MELDINKIRKKNENIKMGELSEGSNQCIEFKL